MNVIRTTAPLDSLGENRLAILVTWDVGDGDTGRQLRSKARLVLTFS
jgi:hypothetical protein